MTIGELRAVRNICVSTGEWPAACDAALRILSLSDAVPEDFRIASGVLGQTGRLSEALPHAVRASRDCPDNLEFAVHAGCIANHCGDYRGAITLFLGAVALDDANPEIYHQLAYASDQLGDLQTATELALRAFRLDPHTQHRGMMAAHLLAKQYRFDEAARLLRQVVEQVDASSYIYHALAYYLDQQRDFAGALEAIDRAIALDPSNAEYHAKRAFALLELGRKEEADAALEQARSLAPDNLSYLRHAVSILAEKDEFEPALRYSGRLIAARPGDAEFASCMRHLLETQALHVSSLSYAEIALLKAQAPPRPSRPAPRLLTGWLNQCRTIAALTLRDIRGRHAESRLGFFWVLMEPIVHIGVLAIVFQFTMHGRPPIGDDFFLFYFTGVMPYLLLNHLIMNVGAASRASRYLMQLSTVTPIDLFFSRAIVEVFTTAVIFLLFSGLFLLEGVDGLPRAPECVLGAFAITWMLGMGIGLISAALHECGVAIDPILGVGMRFLYFSSGIFYVPGNIPLAARDIMVWNPFLHVVDLMRVGYFHAYDPSWLDLSYAFEASLLLLLIGLAAVTALSRQMRVTR
ncbi:MAG TPA: tetratricopeptide repeat protein [Reyranella sp.]|nr:tetratricopeptide repeat protein [Reyranella sp.]